MWHTKHYQFASMNNNEEIQMLESRKPTEKDLFYLNWGLEIVKNQFNVANEVLKQQISICITLLGVSVVFDDLFNDNNKLKLLVVIIFFIGLIISFFGLIPFERKNVWLDSPSDIEDFQKEAVAYKRKCYLFAGISIFVGIFLVVVQIFCEAFF